MNKDITYKLTEVLNQDVYSEQDVVYVLVQLYKLAERKYRKGELEKDFNQIKFYRNWVCHSALYGDSSKVFGEIIPLIKTETEKKNSVGHSDWLDVMSTKIRECFRGYGLLSLKGNILDSLSREIGYAEAFNWESFRVSLYEVIKNIPLIIKDGDDIIFSFECVEHQARLNYDDLSLEAVINNSDRFNFVLSDRTL